MPNDLPPWAAIYQQTQRWLAAGCFEALIDDLRVVLRLAAGRRAEPRAAIMCSRTLRSTPESGERAGYDGANRKKGSKLHIAVDTLGHLLALHVTPANAEDRGEVEQLAQTIQAVTDNQVEIAWVDQGYTGERAAQAATRHGIDLKVVKLPKAKRGFVLLPRRWVVERSFAWATRFRRLVKDYERYAQTLVGLHLVAFATLMAKQTTRRQHKPEDIAATERYEPKMTRLLLFNKPFGVLSQFTDRGSPTVRSTLSDFIVVKGVYPAGRLDRDSEGLLLLCDDGQLQARISDPRFKLPKTYLVQVEGDPQELELERLRQGVQLKDGMTLPADVARIDEPDLWPRNPPIRQRRFIPDSWLKITIREGRNRQVRRMTAAVGLPTLRLVRWSIGDWSVAGIAPGQFAEFSSLGDVASGTYDR